MLVWISNGDKTNAHKRKFHVTPNCFRLRAGIARNKTTQIIAISYEDSFPLRPCVQCAEGSFPHLFKPYCDLCTTWRACPHNGGILVQTGKGMEWVWPEYFPRHEALRIARR